MTPKPSETDPKRLGDRLIAGMRGLLKDIRDGKPVEVTQVRREETPDGPMHTFRKAKVKL